MPFIGKTAAAAGYKKLSCRCNFAGTFVNLLAYADDLVLLAPSWRGMQILLNTVQDAASKIKMSFNTEKNCLHGF